MYILKCYNNFSSIEQQFDDLKRLKRFAKMYCQHYGMKYEYTFIKAAK